MPSARATVAELEARGYTHLRCECAGCRRTVDVSFQFIRQRFPNIAIDGLTTETLRNAMRCQRCPDHPAPTRAKPWRAVDPGRRPSLTGAHVRGRKAS